MACFAASQFFIRNGFIEESVPDTITRVPAQASARGLSLQSPVRLIRWKSVSPPDISNHRYGASARSSPVGS